MSLSRFARTVVAVLSSALGVSVTSAAFAQPPGFVVDNPFPTTTFSFPSQVAFLPGGRRLVAEKDGKVWVMTPAGLRMPTPFIDLAEKTLSTGDRGLLGIAIDPDFAATPWVYFLYTVDPDSNGVDEEVAAYSRLERYQVSALDSNRIDLGTRQVLLGQDWPTGIPAPGSELTHVTGTLRFGTDKTLLVGSGDAAHYSGVDAGGLDPLAFGPGRTAPSEDIGAFRAQSLNSLCGKILRLDKETGQGLPSNPYWNGDPLAARSRVWVYGLRNPFRFGVRPGSGSTRPEDGQPGTLYIADVGWGTWEELDIVRSGGANLGWPCVEGPATNGPYLPPATPGSGCSHGSPENPATPTAPAMYWHHSAPASSSPPGAIARALIAGVYYNGTTYPVEYRNRLFIADFVTSWVRVVDLDASDNVLGLDDFMPGGAASPGALEADPVTGDVWWVNLYSGQVRRLRYVTGNHDPAASASVSPLYGPSPLLVTADARASTDADGDSLRFLWRFGDGDSATTALANHAYAADGVYEIDLEVSDGKGGVDRRAFHIVAGQVPPPGHIILPLRGSFASTGELVRLQAAEVDTTSGPASYRWDVDIGHDTHYHPSQQVLFGPSSQYVFSLHAADESYFNRVRLTVIQGPFTVHDSVEVYPPRDLAVAAVASAPRLPNAGDSLTVSAVLRSVGGLGTHRSQWRLRDGAQILLEEALDAMPPGDSLVVVRRIGPLTSGEHTLLVEADPGGEMVETDESNNSASLVVHVRAIGEPFAEWRADSATGTGPPTVPGAAGPWHELVSGLDGALSGFDGVTGGWWGQGAPGEPWSLRFDGADDHVRLAPGGTFASLIASRDVTAELWVRPGSDVTREQTLLEWLEQLAEPSPGLSLAIAQGRLRVALSPWRDAAPVAPHRWTHVVLVKDSAGARVYQDGVRTYTDGYANSGPQITDARLGASVRAGATPTRAFGGDVAVVRLIDAALDDAAVLASFRADSARFLPAGPPPGRAVVFSADSSDGAGPRPEGASATTWQAVSPVGASALLSGFADPSDTSGWRGVGTPLSPWRAEFDGIDDHAQVAASTLAGLASADSVTVAVWFRPGADVLRAQTLLEWSDPDADSLSGWALRVVNGRLRAYVGGWVDVGPVSPDAWQHLAISGSPGETRLYRNGDQAWVGNSLELARTQPLSLAASARGPGEFTEPFRGAIARVELWRGALTAAAVRELHAAQLAPYRHHIAASLPEGACLSWATPCLEIPFRFDRADSVPVRGFSVTVHLGAGLSLCGPIVPGDAFGSEDRFFEARDLGGGTWIVDGAVLGASCLSGAGSLFRVRVTTSLLTGTGRVTVDGIKVRGCTNQVLAADPGAPLEIRIDRVLPSAPGPITITPVGSPQGPAWTMDVRPTFTVPSDAAQVRVIRAPFGNAPEYDDTPDPGAPPPPPTWPPVAPWTLTGVDWSGRIDSAGPRDCWYYAAFVWDSCGNRSAPQTMPACRVNYPLADFAGAAGQCSADGRADAIDHQAMLAHYGASLYGGGDPRRCLDIGPTLGRVRDGRPLTDNRLDFEDLMVMGLGSDLRLPAGTLTAAPNEIVLEIPPLPSVGDTFQVTMVLQGNGALHGLHTRVGFDSTRVRALRVVAGALLSAQGLPAMVAASAPELPDVVLLGGGPGFEGSGPLVRITFQVLAPGAASFSLTELAGRDSANADLVVHSSQLIVGVPPRAPARLGMSAGWPDPFTDQVTFEIRLPQPSLVTLAVFDLQGRRVRRLIDGPQLAGTLRRSWDGRDDRGVAVAPGVYLARLDAAGEARVRRVVRLR